ncbi:MAG: phosphonoacetaldehyde reductase [Planctomycetales bacterium]|nr:phosphonoacetaldehyde reductase [Planctomycetales bacterium]MCA9166704.1 phosphonoacetaldehyde reductase [Planctomycetales bacterium]
MSTVLNHLEALQPIVESHDWRRILLIADADAVQLSGAADRLHEILWGRDVEVFDQFTANPTWEPVLEATQCLVTSNAEAIIAVGGGTAIDIAKLVSHFRNSVPLPTEPTSVNLLLASNITESRQIPLVAIPTTAGTGSEATRFAVLYVGDQKFSVSHPMLVPDYVVLDPTLTYSLPPGITAASGLDAMSQAIESMWSIKATTESLTLAERALRLCAQHLVPAVCHPNPTNRAAMLEAAHLAGQAINISETTAAHALSYSMTIRHGVPHGKAVAISIATLLRRNATATVSNLNDSRGLGHLQAVVEQIIDAVGIPSGEIDDVNRFCDYWQQLLRQVGCPTRLQDWRITRQDCVAIVDSVNLQRLANNPRQLNRTDLLEMLAEVYGEDATLTRSS